MGGDSVSGGVVEQPFVSRLAAGWLRDSPSLRHRRIPGTMLFADISGFTKLTERLARRGKVGAEVMSDTLDLTFAALLAPAFAEGADLLKWGGDAVLLLFRGEGHASRASSAAYRMRAGLRDLVRSGTLPIEVPLRMSIGVHSAGGNGDGGFDAFLVGDQAIHRELIVAGPDISRLVAVEQVCGAGQILLSPATAALLPARLLGDRVDVDGGAARLLRSRPDASLDPPDGAEAGHEGGDVSGILPPEILSRIRSGGGAPEHRPVAVAFVQFTGIDALLEQQGADAAARAVHEVVSAVQHACGRHGVTFFESDIAADGGKVMLTAGAPRSTGRDAERMLRVACDVAAHGGALGVRVGVNAGHVFAGELGPAFRRTYSVKGDAVNLAARLLGRAASGQVVATAAVVAGSRADVESEQLAPFAVKGKRHPVHAVVVRRVRDAHATRFGEIRFVGRDDELRQLRAALAAAVDGRGAVIEIAGEPGIGKSRLVAETGVPEGMRALVVTVGNYEAGTPYAAVGALLRSVLDIGMRDGPEVVATVLEERVRAVAPDLLPWLPLLGVPLDVELATTRDVEELEERFRRGRIEDATVALLDALLAAPTLFLLEDVHLMDEASGSLLHRLERELPDHRWCVVVTRRETEGGYLPLRAGPHDRRIALDAIPPERALELLESAAGGALPSRHALDAMAERARGNPLFLTALAAGMHSPSADDDLPGSIEGLLIADIDRLGTGDRALLRLAAVLGARFDAGFLAELDEAAAHADEVVARLGEFIRPVEGGLLEFRHALVRDVAYAGLPFRLRRDLHERVAIALESSGGLAAPDLLSLHFHAAGIHDKARSHSLEAAEEARSKYAYGQAAVFFERALDSAAHLPQVTAEARAQARLALGDCLDMSGDANGALAALRQARAGLQADAIATADVLYKEARIRLRLGRYRAALAQLTRAMRLLDAVEGPAADAVRARLATRYGFCLHLQRRGADAVRWGRLGVRWAEASGDDGVLAHACNALHLAYGASALAEDRPYGKIALDLYVQSGDLSGQALTLNNLAIDAYDAGRWNEAIDEFGRAADSFHRLGDDANEATALYNRADVLVAQRRHAEASPVLRVTLRLARRVDDEELVGLVLREQARAEAGAGDRGEATTLFDKARAVLAGLDLASEVALLDAARAEALAAAGAIPQALALIDETIRVAETKASDALARLHRIRAQALVAQGRNEQAVAAAEAGLACATGGYGGYEPALLRLAIADATGDRDLRAHQQEVLAALGVVG
ncbi:AAA family ATPase [Microbacterium sp. SD291]|uniref:AAA family ATPase n=1 Tax=Microbacterium sp. SD291 TaxID=2782007 RepID=UPI001A972E9C|nr:adenylate/guanylate cyclase domain-containing protein [Microbacterium sp. SD291]MBO0981228.1 AAA family ATPase [Microbacterium sp. SD291]